MNLDTIAGWTIAALCAGLLAWHYASAAWRSLGNLRGSEHAWATIPRDPFYDTLRDQYAEAGRDLPVRGDAS